MDINKFDRILKIYFLLQSRSVVPMEELRRRFQTSERTLFRDLKALERAGIPVVNEAGAGYSILEGFRLQPARFTEEEIIGLVVAEKMMQAHETDFIRQHFDSALTKIKSSFRYQQKNDVLDLEDKLQIPGKGKARDYLPNVMDVLLSCILKKKVAAIRYLKQEEEAAVTREVEPVGVYYEHGNWYLLAYCHLRQAYRSFRLDRIRQICAADKAFTRAHPAVNELRARQSAEPATAICIRVQRRHARYLYWEREIFGFEREAPDGDWVVMHFACPHPPKFFVRWFLMFADVAEIVHPADLREELLSILEAGVQNTKKALP